LAAQQYLGKVGHVANGVLAVTSQWTDGTRHAPLGVKPYQPASRLPKGRQDLALHTKPALWWQLIGEARAAGSPFRLAVADAVYSANAALEAQPFAAHIPYVMGLRPMHATWQIVEDAAHPPTFTSAEAAAAVCHWRRESGRCASTATATNSCATWSNWSWDPAMARPRAYASSPPPLILSTSSLRPPGI
jgi:SRSO17 transposase